MHPKSYEIESVKQKVETIRSQFEYWYTTQMRDQIATFHPFETLEEFDKKEFPFGRYTVFSEKQKAWQTFLAGYFTATNEVALVPDDHNTD